MCHPPNQKYTSLPASRRDLTSQTRPTLKNIFCYIFYPILRAACLDTNFSQWNHFLVFAVSTILIARGAPPSSANQ